jgi:hypothetical protein
MLCCKAILFAAIYLVPVATGDIVVGRGELWKHDTVVRLLDMVVVIMTAFFARHATALKERAIASFNGAVVNSCNGNRHFLRIRRWNGCVTFKERRIL